MTRQTTGFTHRAFAGDGGTEHYITITAPEEIAPGGQSLTRQIDAIASQYAEALQSLRLTPDTAVFRRIFLSDAANQAAVVKDSSLVREPLDSPVAVSIVQQPPLPGGKVAMLAYHVETPRPATRRRVGRDSMLLRTGELGHLWTTRLCASDTKGPSSAWTQTQEAFERLADVLHANGATLADQCVRTWIYVKDVDVFYQDVVDSRIELFERHGLTRDTHYIASTGIEGGCAHRYDVMLMDAYSVLGLRPEQISYLNDFDKLCHTKDYNVTFERGTRIAYADRAHHFISGTASIDDRGRVVHVGDVRRQLDRALENVDGLLRSGGATLDDMTHLIVYLRDPSDYPMIDGAIAERFPAMPRLVVRGAVCRPDWLVEVEGIAITPNDAPHLPRY